MADTFSLTGSLRLNPIWVEESRFGDTTRQADYVQTFSFADGNGTNQSTAFYAANVSLSSLGNTTLDLRSLSVSEFAGSNNVSLSSVRMLLVRNNNANHTLTLAPGSSDGWTNWQGGANQTVPAQGVLFATSPAGGINTTASNKTLLMTNGGNETMNVDVILVGVQT